MAVILAKDIVARCSITLQDPAFVRWTQSELLQWCNDGQREIVKYRPDASSVHRQVALVAGTVQALPATDLRLLRAVRNMGVGGAVPGTAIRLISKDSLDIDNPNWHTDPASAVVERVVYDEEDPKTFYVYPPQPAGGGAQGTIEIVDSTPPANATINGVGGAGADTVISIDDIYANDLYNYTMGKALSKESEYANPMAGNAYMQMFSQSMGIKGGADSNSDPNKTSKV